MPAAGRAWTLGALAALFSFAFAWVPSFWADEVATVRASRLTPAELLPFTTRYVDAGHTVYYVALHYWSGIFGFGEAGTRGFSALGVGVAVALTALIGQRLGRPRLALFAAVLLAFMPRLTWAGAEARSYAWTAALAATAWLLLLIALDSGGWWWAALGAAIALSVSTFLLTSTLVVAQLLFVLLRRDTDESDRPNRGIRSSRRAWIPLLVTWFVALAAASPILTLAWQERAQIAWIGPNSAFNAWTVLVEPAGETSWGYAFAVWILIIAGAVRWRAALRAACPEWLLLAGCWVIVPFAITIGISLLGSPVFTSRYLTFAMPGLALALAAALAALSARRLVAAVTIALLVIALPTYVGQRLAYAKPRESDLREVAQTVAAHSQPGDAILFAPGRPREALYAYPQYFDGLVDVALKTPFPASDAFHDKTVPLAKRTAKLAGIRSLILVIPRHGTPCTQPRDAKTLLENGFAPASRYPTHREVVCRFERAG
ncbi:glycosyltransferase family 39 protein [Gryllotalpicola daejeonensis]|uniref:Glycosyltransferase family 39 protein n=1 Tax=Gryllotalpicola daejeonensis TaxID=993087 RepID=A0ABP7ZK15_9MICO